VHGLSRRNIIPCEEGVNEHVRAPRELHRTMSDRRSGLRPVGPVSLVDLFPGLHHELRSLLRGLHPPDWERPTACALWSVKDIAAHLLDTGLRRLSFGRDGLRPQPEQHIDSYQNLVAYLNKLNNEWVIAARRLSPRILMDLLDHLEPELHAFFRTLDPNAPAPFGVAWAGEEVSPNWFDIGREFTERWLHQQQIREAVGAPGLNEPAWLYPVLDIFVRALPFTYRAVEGSTGRSLELEILGPAGGVWTLRWEPQTWQLYAGSEPAAVTRVRLDQETAWKLFSKGLSPAEAARRIEIEGDLSLGLPVLRSLAVMA
jgi:uncharacterized protein (TIGR03083 family)